MAAQRLQMQTHDRHHSFVVAVFNLPIAGHTPIALSPSPPPPPQIRPLPQLRVRPSRLPRSLSRMRPRQTADTCPIPHLRRSLNYPRAADPPHPRPRADSHLAFPLSHL